jgi:uncharacterized protein YfaS (alpha-2-macroglobulin family)
MTRRNVLVAIGCYLAVIALVFVFAILRVRTQNRFAAQTAPETLPEYPEYKTPPPEDAKPFFSLQTNRTYGTTDRARVWVNYRGLEQLDFRVYRVKDPVKFFKQLANPHQVGEDEEAEIAESVKRQPTFLEKLRAFKSRIYTAIKGYVRAQLKQDSRKGFNQKFRRTEEEDDTSNRTPLNVADYARVPLLNPDQLVSSWREKLPPLEDMYDRRMISLGKREPGVYLVEAVNGDLRAYGVVLVTDLTMVQKTSNDGQLLVYAVERRSGAPREGVQVEISKGKESVKSGATDRQGILRMQLTKPPAEAADEGQAAGDEQTGADEAAAEETSGEATDEEETSESYLIMARAGENFAISDLDSFYFSEGGEEEDGSDSNLTSYLYTDRPVYRPQQKVYFKGILRGLTENGYKLLGGRSVTVTIEDSNSSQVFEKELPLSSRGTFNGEFDIPEEAPLGSYNIKAQVGEATATGYFEVQEYKKPEFKVTVNVPDKYVNVGEKMRFTVTGRYFFGAPVARADVKYYIYRSRYYSWWGGDGGEDDSENLGIEAEPGEEEPTYGGGYGDNMVQEGEGKTDAQGRFDVEFTVPQPDAKDTWDYEYRLEAQVTDPSRRTMDGAASFVGVRSNTTAYASPERYVYYQGDNAKILVTTRDHEGRPVSTKVKLTFVERRWEKVVRTTEYGDEYPDYDLKERELSSAFVETNAQGEASSDYNIQIPGSIHIKTTIEENGRQVTTEGGSIWVADRNNQWSDVSYDEEGAIKLVPDKKSYRAGETAHVLALLPTDKAHLLVTTELMSVMSVRQIDSAGRAVIIDLPIEARFAPNIFLNVTYVRNSDMYTQDQMIVVPARDKLLDLQIIPNKKEYRPRETASYTVLARNADGSPASGAEVSLGVVDESIYSIAPESVEDIRRTFYGQRYNQVSTSFAINYSFTGYAGTKPVNLAQNKRAYQLADFKNEGELVNPLIRKIFKDTAFWQPAAVTGADGKATVQFELPDNLTTWRATARAITADTRVGTATDKVVERKDVIMRVAMPRFLTEGDTVTLSGIVHNYLKEDKVTQISLEVTGARLLDAATQTVTIPKQGDYRVDWRVAAPNTGELKILGKALTNQESDALETSIPIVPRGLKQTRGEASTFADEDTDKTFSYNLPANAEPFARQLRIEVSPSIASTLFGALDYLTSFPYGCTEQTMSSFMPNVIVAQALKNVQSATIKDTNNINRKVQKGLRRLYSYQHEDGGWGWWKDDATDAFMTAYVVDGLAMARRANYEVDQTRLDRAREKLKAMIETGRTDEGKEIDAETRAYMIYAMNESGWADPRYLNDLFSNRGSLQPYGRALLALALKEKNDKRAATVAGEIERGATASDADAHWASQHKTLHGGADESNDVEATALSVKALAQISPQSSLLPKAARWLVRSRRNGYYWTSTKETAFAIYGLTDYLKVSQELTPNYTVEVYLNDEQLLSKQMTAADAQSGQAFVINRRGREVAGDNNLRIVKRGRGMLYLSVTLVHYTSGEEAAAKSSSQLKLTREYLRLRVEQDAEGNLKWKTEALTGELRSGDVIVSRLRLEGQRAQYLLIEDPIPAGCEQLESSGGLSLDSSDRDWSDWYSAREFRDQRAVFFLNYFDGKAVYQYAMRVQSPGEFRIAPARVEQMYQPSVQANTSTGSLTILDNK